MRGLQERLHTEGVGQDSVSAPQLESTWKGASVQMPGLCAPRVVLQELQNGIARHEDDILQPAMPQASLRWWLWGRATKGPGVRFPTHEKMVVRGLRREEVRILRRQIAEEAKKSTGKVVLR